MTRLESYSSLATGASCWEKYRLAYVERLEAPGLNLAMHNGSAMHAAMRSLYHGGFSAAKLPQAIEALAAEWGDTKPPLGDKKAHLTREFATKRLEMYVAEREASPTILETGEALTGFVEEMHVFEWSVSGHLVTLRGIPDLVVTHEGHRYVVDHKFPTSEWITDHYWMRFGLGFQLRIYAALVEQVAGLKIDGGLINAVSCNAKACDPPEAWKKRKSSPSGIKTISFTREQIEDAHEWIRGNLLLRDACESANLWPRNEHACGEFNGCEFIPLCSAPTPMARRARMMTNFRRKEER